MQTSGSDIFYYRNRLLRGALAVWAALVALPLVLVLLAAARVGADASAWAALWSDPALWRAWALSTGSAVVSTGVSVLLCAAVLGERFASRRWDSTVRTLGPMLALPHAALAVAVLMWLAPSGWVLRLLSPWATGWDAPPPWPTSQDPWALGLTLALVLKEVPFLLWAAAAHLRRPELAQRLRQELRCAHTLGYSQRSAWWRVGWPQVWPRLQAPVLAVLAYSLTTVDMALLLGPTTPPTLAVLGWQWLQDPDPARNALGAAAATLLALTLLALCALAWVLHRSRRYTRWCAQGLNPFPAKPPSLPAAPAAWRQKPATAHPFGLMEAWRLVYGGALATLAVGSVIGVWPFPSLWPTQWSVQAWSSVAQQWTVLGQTAVLGLSSAAAALLWCVVWLEWGPRSWVQRSQGLWYLPLVLPALLWVLGLHQVLLRVGLDASATGLWLAHTLAALPYVLLALHGPYTAFPARMGHTAAALGRSRWSFLWRVKWPLLRAALCSALAVGFAVSVAQYLPTLYIGAGRFATVTTEAVAQASSGARALAAAWAWLQWLLPVACFAWAAWAGRERIFIANARPAPGRAGPPCAPATPLPPDQ